jgi:hypothetical protein
MLKNGLYRLDFRDIDDDTLESADTLAVLRNGRILGSDPLGGVFSGHYEAQTADASSSIDLQMQVPPDSTLVTGHTTESRQKLFAIKGTLAPSPTGAQADVTVLGRKLRVGLTYLGSVPQ